MNRRFRHALLCLLAFAPGLCDATVRRDPAERLQQQLRIEQQRYGIVGQSVEISHDGKPLFQGVDGASDLDSGQRVAADDIFPVYSLAKLFVSTLLMQLVEQGKVDLDRPASAYLRDLPEPWKAISVRQFLNHTSGVAEYYTPEQMAGTAEANASFPASLPAALAVAAARPMQFAPGSRTRYTQTNYLVLTQLLETHYGQPYPRIARERILVPLGLQRTWLGRDGLPARGVVFAYRGQDGKAQPMPDVAWPAYAVGHSALYMSRGDLSAFLRAVAAGELVSKATLMQLWQPLTLSGGQRGEFLSGWESGDSGSYRNVGHDGGTVVRARILFNDSLDRNVYTIVYLTNGSARNVWSRTLVDDLMGVLAPQRFPAQALADRIAAFALRAPDDARMQAFADSLRADRSVEKQQLERTINNTGYALRESHGADVALRAFLLNTRLFPKSANAWDSLAETYEAKGDLADAKAARRKQQALSTPSR
ncbi:serine hydrolase [Lysobacter capsici]|uniref:serine hydrolase domain-containing protein n=1 Tax=Lysobacter capsici TaxID=435897 RepID=UPI00177EADE6|nr:serine hydrolase domain-containing protein [Lysobacter capsici]UOF16756.1 serine hydrolase [Lysobacter capsici]